MGWRAKVLLHWMMPVLPYGSNLHYWYQKNISKTIPIRTEYLKIKVETARRHIAHFHRHTAGSIKDAVFYEVGTGWELAVQLIFYSLGVNHQITVDVKRLLRAELVNNSVKRIRELDIPQLKRLPDHLIDGDLNRELTECYGIDYCAPFDARMTHLNNETIDCITSSDTFQHIPRTTLVQILHECRRILKNEGIMSVHVNYDDHYMFADNRISHFNFLKYSDFQWRFLNPSTHFQNRLRHSDYLSIFAEAGFAVLDESVIQGSEDDRQSVKNGSLARKFKNYSSDDLVCRGGHFILRKRV
jgi:hypothetical protein